MVKVGLISFDLHWNTKDESSMLAKTDTERRKLG